MINRGIDCFHTRISRGGRVLEHGHMAWPSANDALTWAKCMFQDPPRSGRFSFSIELDLCQSDLCPVREAIDRGIIVSGLSLDQLPPLE